jgi:hypothetical protein
MGRTEHHNCNDVKRTETRTEPPMRSHPLEERTEGIELQILRMTSVGNIHMGIGRECHEA